MTERFREAADAARKRNIAGATSVLETAVKEGALPAVFHDLGVGYAALGDFPRAADAFREVLARDPEYAPTRLYLHSSKSIFAGAAEPYGREQEPNNDQSTANLIAVRSAVGGELAGGNDTSDYFRVVAPAAPRDLITIELANNSPGFSPRLHVYDSDLRLLSWGDKTARPGDSLTITGGPAPNSTLYIAISAADSNGGLYLLSVTPQKAFDKFEPNDDILSSRHISMGEEVPANIMDVEDTDFFSFVGPRKGKVTIQLRNRSTTLIPAVTTLNNDHRNLGFAQDARKAGQDVQYSIDVDKDLTYYVEISSQGGTSGAYTLRVE